VKLRGYLPAWAHEWIDILVPGLQIVGILLVAWLLLVLVHRVLVRTAERYQLPIDLVRPVRNGLRWIIYGAASLLIMERLGVSATVLWTGFTGFVTVAAVAFFAVWSVLSNLFCAILIYSTRPFKVNDVVELIDSGDKPGIKGRVIDIRLVYTTLEDVMPEHQGAVLQVPNSLFFQKALRRWRSAEAPAASMLGL
jgi:small-conductance mechanosensitive channel